MYRLVQHDPALTKQERQRIKTLPNDSELLLNTALQRLGIDEGEIQSYLEQQLDTYVLNDLRVRHFLLAIASYLPNQARLISVVPDKIGSLPHQYV